MKVKRSVIVCAMIAALGAMMVISVGAAGETVQQALATGMEQVKTDVLDTIATAVPIAIGIGATMIAIRLGWKFFKGMAKG